MSAVGALARRRFACGCSLACTQTGRQILADTGAWTAHIMARLTRPLVHTAPPMLQVHAGQDLCVVEAMKMQNVLTAPRDGVVKELLASAGSTLSADQAILSFEDATKAARA